MWDPTAIHERLKKFDITKDDAGKFLLIKQECLSPDSWAHLTVRLQDPGRSKFFVLYSEDFIESLEQIRKIVEQWAIAKVTSFVKLKDQSTSPASISEHYTSQTGQASLGEWVNYALPDNGNYTFLLEVAPTAENQTFWALHTSATGS